MLESARAALYALDVAALYDLNVAWDVPALDPFWSAITQLHKQYWFLFGVLPIGVAGLLLRYRGRALRALLGALLAVALTDALAYRVIKRVVHRPRPFENAELSWVVKRGLAHGPSFPSNHAANAFAAAGFLSWYARRARAPLYGFAGLIALSRPILGVHYPSDVLAGAALGLAVAFALGRAACAFPKSGFRSPFSGGRFQR